SSWRPPTALRFEPPLEPGEVPPHDLSLLRGLGEHVSAAREDFELHSLAEGFQSLVELLGFHDWDAPIVFSVLDEKWSRHVFHERDRRVRAVSLGVLDWIAEVLDHEIAAVG